MRLHVESSGSGAPLLLIHGWGMHGGVWDAIAPQLATAFRVHRVDLPGYGYSKNAAGIQAMQLDEMVEQLSAGFDQPLTVCGWSLGGQLALRWAALRPAQVERLILLASTPCFSERADWSGAMEKTLLEQFAAELERDHAATLRRFLALQLRGSEHERELLLKLRSNLFARGEPDLAALRAGLDILRDVDLRAALPGITQPILVIAGERDKLTPVAASRYMAQTMPNARLLEIKGAAHAPFLSHPEICVDAISSFLSNKQSVDF